MKEQDAIQVIEEMIQKTKNDLSDDGRYYMLWGWAVFISAWVHLYFELFPYRYFPSFFIWPISMGVAGILSFSMNKREARVRRVKSYMEEFVTKLWGAFGITMGLGIFLTLNLAPLMCYPFVLLLYGLGTYTTGRILKFRPLLFGAFACWALACVSIYVSFNVQLVLLATGVLLSYIIPGYILQQRYRNRV